MSAQATSSNRFQIDKTIQAPLGNINYSINCYRIGEKFSTPLYLATLQNKVHAYYIANQKLPEEEILHLFQARQFTPYNNPNQQLYKALFQLIKDINPGNAKESSISPTTKQITRQASSLPIKRVLSNLSAGKIIKILSDKTPQNTPPSEPLVSLKSKVTSFFGDVKEIIQTKANQVFDNSKTLFSSPRVLRNTITKISLTKIILTISLVANFVFLINHSILPTFSYFKEKEELTTLEHIVRGLNIELELILSVFKG